MKKFYVKFLCLIVFFNPISFLYGSESNKNNKQIYSLMQLEFLIDQARQLKLSEDPQWLNLLHYGKNIFGLLRGQAGNIFYLSKDGHKNSEEELELTLRSFFTENNSLVGDEQHPQCRFRARYLYFNNKLKIKPNTFPQVNCSRFEKFSKAIEGRSVTVVFSSYYLNNPSSALGHSFIRINKADHSKPGKNFELLDYGINYAADLDSSGFFVYSFKAFTGLFEGIFSTVPYYHKVREYNNYEARDLWEYELTLSPEEVNFLVAHVWELGTANFRYYYLTENCSYHVLSVLDAVRPSLDLVKRQPKVVIPSDTIKIIMDTPGLVSNIQYRPALKTIFENRIKNFSNEHVEILKENLKSKNPELLPEELTAQEKAKILDAESDFVEVNYSQSIIDKIAEPSEWIQKIHVARSKINVVTQEDQFKPVSHQFPHLGHGSSRATVTGGFHTELGSMSKISYKLGLHDLLDPLGGYPDTADMSVFDLTLRYNINPPRHALWFEDLTLVRIISLNPLTQFDKRLSWKAQASVTRFYDGTCNYCVGPQILSGGGVSFQFTQNRANQIFVMGESEIAASPYYNGSRFRLGLGPVLGMRVSIYDHLNLLLQGKYHYIIWSKNPHVYQGELDIRWGFHKDWALNLKGAAFTKDQELTMGVLYYY